MMRTITPIYTILDVIAELKEKGENMHKNIDFVGLADITTVGLILCFVWFCILSCVVETKFELAVMLYLAISAAGIATSNPLEKYKILLIPIWLLKFTIVYLQSLIRKSV